LTLHLFAGLAETALAMGEGEDRLLELFAIEVGPQHRREIEFRIGQLPDQEIGDALLATGADEQVRFGQIVQAEPFGQAFGCDLVRRQGTGLNVCGQLPGGLGDVPAPAVVGGDIELEAGVVAGQEFGLLSVEIR